MNGRVTRIGWGSVAADRRVRSAPAATVAALMVVTLLALPGSADSPAPLPPRTLFSLNGDWRFALDATRDGEAWGWPTSDLDEGRWDHVEVPHCWPLDPRYQYTGPAWYRKSFTPPPEFAGRHVRLAFGAVFARARVWLNGRRLGSHEGGYTPFDFDVTGTLVAGKPNVLVVEADNSWSTETLPGARPGPLPTHRVYPWWNYGGIVRDVALVAQAPVEVANQRVVAVPDLERGTATLEATAWVRNASAAGQAVRLAGEVARLGADGSRTVVADARRQRTLGATVTVEAGETRPVTLRATLPREAVTLWTLDRPTLYQFRTAVLAPGAEAPVDIHEVAFGIRSIEARGTKLLLNGHPVRLGGGHRPSDHPRFGLIDPPEAVERDLGLMKAAGMELQRLVHHAAAPALLEAADRLGMLIIAEAGNWQLQPSQMDSPALRADFQNQMREMVERDWNHPSIIGWSVGNEYESQTASGIRWTKDMAAYVRSLDPSRLVTFASFRAFRPEITAPDGEGSAHVDLVSVNIYTPPPGLGDLLDRVHARWPDKPVFVSEFGRRADKVASEEERRRYFADAIALIRTKPFVVGASVWTFQDYRSRFPDTAPNGYRPWGLVDPDRKPRGAYDTVKAEFATARIVTARAEHRGTGMVARVEVEARSDFPSRPLAALAVRVRTSGDVPAPGSSPGPSSPPLDLAPGQRRTVELALPAAWTGRPTVAELVRPDGSVMHEAPLAAGQVSTNGAGERGASGCCDADRRP